VPFARTLEEAFMPSASTIAAAARLLRAGKAVPPPAAPTLPSAEPEHAEATFKSGTGLAV
jgi:hypothetical protein